MTPSITSTLPANGIWAKGTAPASRFQAIAKELESAQSDAFEKLSAKGNGAADTAIIQQVQDEFEQIRNDILQSQPQYPDPHSYIQSLLGTCDRMYSWKIQYHAGSQNGPVLVEFDNIADEEHNFFKYATSDSMSSQISSLADGVKNLEDFVTTSLQDPKPFEHQEEGGLFDKKAKGEILTGMFGDEKSGLGGVESAAATVSQQGIAETSSTDCGSNYWDENARAWRKME